MTHFSSLSGLCLMMILTAVALASGCASQSEAPRVNVDRPRDFFGQWTLTAIEGQALAGPSKDQKDAPPAPTLIISDDGAAGGYAGVNRFTGRADLTALAQGEWRVGPMASTRMAGPPDRMDLESRYLKLLSEATSITRVGDGLVLRNGGREVLRFGRGG